MRQHARHAPAREDEQQADCRDPESDRRFNPDVPAARDEEGRQEMAIEPGLIHHQRRADERQAEGQHEAGKPRSHGDECMLIPGGGGLQC